MVMDPTHLSKLAKSLNTDEQNLLKLINKSIKADKAKLAELYNAKSRLDPKNGAFRIDSNTKPSSSSFRNPSTSKFKSKAASSSLNDENSTNSKLATHSLFFKTPDDHPKSQQSSSQRRNISFSFNNPTSNVRTDILSNLFIKNNIEMNNTVHRKNSFSKNPSNGGKMVPDFLTYTANMSNGNDSLGNLFDNSNLTFKSPGSINSNKSSVTPPKLNGSNKPSLTFDHVFSNLNLIYPAKTPTPSSPNKPGGATLKKSNSNVAQTLINSKLNVKLGEPPRTTFPTEQEMSRNELKQLMSFKKSNFASVVNSLDKIGSERDTNNKLNNDNTARVSLLNVGKPAPNTQVGLISPKSRDPNDSYAYTDVKKYIEENELMSPQKERDIQLWVIQVNSQRDNWDKNFIDSKIEVS